MTSKIRKGKKVKVHLGGSEAKKQGIVLERNSKQETEKVDQG